MTSPETLSDCRVGILGLGLMGGSLAKALKGHCKKIYGWDLDSENLLSALKEQVIDAGSPYFDELVNEIDLLVLAVPVETILAIIPGLPEVISGSLMVMDIGSTKSAIMHAFNLLPERFDVLGGHPMCGKARGGYSESDAEMYYSAHFTLVRGERTSAIACHLGEKLVEVVGAQAIWLSAEEHDRWVSATSHLPYLVSCALAETVPLEAAPLIGPGFKSATRLAQTPLSMMGDILRTNQSEILARFDSFLEQLQSLRDLFASGSEDAFFQRLDGIKKHHQYLLEKNQAGSCHEN
jgi:prephenate dehydrogenase